MQTIIKVRGIIIKENSIFLVKDSESGKFMLPGGKQEDGETIKQTLYREIKEETGIYPIIEDFFGFREYKSKIGIITVEFLFKLKNIDDFEKIDKSKCSHGFEWTEAGFYELKDLINNNLNFPPDLEKIFKKEKSKNNTYKYFI